MVSEVKTYQIQNFTYEFVLARKSKKRKPIKVFFLNMPSLTLVFVINIGTRGT